MLMSPGGAVSDWKVLLVDDEKDFLENLYERLSHVFGKMNVLIASSAEEAFPLLKNQPIGVIISDHRMPGLSGHELLEEVARRWPDVIRILLTGASDISSIRHSTHGAQAHHYLSKQTSLADLEIVVRQGMKKFFSEEKQRQLLKAKQEFLKNLYIEERLLPEESPKIPGLYFDTYYQSAQEVGGDYFDFIEIDPHHLGIVVADVSGKGLQSAMLMSTLCYALRSQAVLSLSPSEVIDETEGMVLPKLGPDHFITLFYAILDCDSMTLTCANAGHPPLLLGNRKTGKNRWIHPRGLAIGLSRYRRHEEKRAECEIALHPDDFLFLYTDGVTEVRNSHDDCYGRRRLQEFFSGNSRKNLDVIHDLKTELENFSEGAPQQDDVTAVYMERCAV